jgi:hypothetical protein
MSEQGGDRPWFRRRRSLGLGYSAASWQGVAAILVFVTALLVTVFSGDPNLTRPSKVAAFLRAKTMMGLGGTHLSMPSEAALILAEVAAFMLVVWWKSRVLKPLD